jgi:hypothetical protein
MLVQHPATIFEYAEEGSWVEETAPVLSFYLFFFFSPPILSQRNSISS